MATCDLTGEGAPLTWPVPTAFCQRNRKLALGSGGGPGQREGPVRLELARGTGPRPGGPSGPGTRRSAFVLWRPITRFGDYHNAIEMAVANPPGRLQRLLPMSSRRSRWPRAHPAGRCPAPKPPPRKTLSCCMWSHRRRCTTLLSPGQFRESQLHLRVPLTQAGGSLEPSPEPANAPASGSAQQAFGLIAGVVLGWQRS